MMKTLTIYGGVRGMVEYTCGDIAVFWAVEGGTDHPRQVREICETAPANQ